MHLQDQDIEAKLKPVQELKCSDFAMLWEVWVSLYDECSVWLCPSNTSHLKVV